MSSKIIFLGMGLDSANRGVNALCIGAAEIVNLSYKVNGIVLISFQKNAPDVEYILSTSSGDLKIVNKFYSKKDLLLTLGEVFLFKIFNKKPTSVLGKEIYNSDLVFDLNEGDSFSDIYGFNRILRHFMDTFTAISFNKKTIFLPQTIGPFNTFIGRKMGLYILKRLEKVYVRDDKAISLLSKNNIQYIQTIDLAVYMKPKEISFDIPENSIMINVNGLMYFNNYDSLKDQFNAYKNLLLKIVNHFQMMNKDIVFLPHTYDLQNHIEEDDLNAIINFIEVNNIQNVSVVNKDLDVQELKYLISKADFFIGSRMHSCIGALSTSVPAIGLAYSYKFDGTYKMFKQRELVINTREISDIDIKNILEKIDMLYSQRNSIKQELIEFNKKVVKLQV